MSDFDARAIVVGGGPVGLVSAALLAQAGVPTLCVAPPPSVDPRTTALLAPSLRLLESLGAWTDELKAACAPLKYLHLHDDTGQMLAAPDLNFSAQEAGLEAFGWNVPLADIAPVLRERAAALGVTLIDGEAISARLEGDGIECVLHDGRVLSAQFAVAADGRHSVLRKAAGIAVDEWAFEQSALVTRFQHSRDHEHVSTEWHKMGGPFTTVPLPGKNSALVWLGNTTDIRTHASKDTQALAREIQLQCHGTLGLVSSVAPAHLFAMRGLTAQRFAASRTFLVGEAAHVFPPIGAQGLNMSLRDAGHMVDVVLAHTDAGADAALSDYERLRRPDVVPRQFAISMMNRSLLADVAAPHVARSAGLAAVAGLPALRSFVIREGLAPSAGLPFAMRG